MCVSSWRGWRQKVGGKREKKNWVWETAAVEQWGYPWVWVWMCELERVRKEGGMEGYRERRGQTWESAGSLCCFIWSSVGGEIRDTSTQSGVILGLFEHFFLGAKTGRQMLVFPAELSAAVCVCVCAALRRRLSIRRQAATPPLLHPSLRSPCHQPSDCNELILYPPPLLSLCPLPSSLLALLPIFLHFTPSHTFVHICFFFTASLMPTLSSIHPSLHLYISSSPSPSCLPWPHPDNIYVCLTLIFIPLQSPRPFSPHSEHQISFSDFLFRSPSSPKLPSRPRRSVKRLRCCWI